MLIRSPLTLATLQPVLHLSEGRHRLSPEPNPGGRALPMEGCVEVRPGIDVHVTMAD